MKVFAGFALAISLIPAAMAAPRPAAVPGAVSTVNPDVIRVEGGCGRDFFRGRDGYCHPFGGERMREERWEERHERLACPRGYHLGEGGRQCWPNR